MSGCRGGREVKSYAYKRGVTGTNPVAPTRLKSVSGRSAGRRGTLRLIVGPGRGAFQAGSAILLGARLQSSARGACQDGRQKATALRFSCIIPVAKRRMMTGPGDEVAAGDTGHLRASQADREQVIDTLKVAFVQGRLTKSELDRGLGQALTARTYAELAAVTADIRAESGLA